MDRPHPWEADARSVNRRRCLAYIAERSTSSSSYTRFSTRPARADPRFSQQQGNQSFVKVFDRHVKRRGPVVRGLFNLLPATVRRRKQASLREGQECGCSRIGLRAVAGVGAESGTNGMSSSTTDDRFPSMPVACGGTKSVANSRTILSRSALYSRV